MAERKGKWDWGRCLEKLGVHWWCNTERPSLHAVSSYILCILFKSSQMLVYTQAVKSTGGAGQCRAELKFEEGWKGGFGRHYTRMRWLTHQWVKSLKTGTQKLWCRSGYQSVKEEMEPTGRKWRDQEESDQNQKGQQTQKPKDMLQNVLSPDEQRWWGPREARLVWQCEVAAGLRRLWVWRGAERQTAADLERWWDVTRSHPYAAGEGHSCVRSELEMPLQAAAG